MSEVTGLLFSHSQLMFQYASVLTDTKVEAFIVMTVEYYPFVYSVTQV